MASTCMAWGCADPHMANVMLSAYEKCVCGVSQRPPPPQNELIPARACVVPVGREQKLHGRRRFGGGGCGQEGRSWGRRSGFEMTHPNTCYATLAKRFWMADVWNRCSQVHYLMHVLTSSACSLGSILHFVGFYLSDSWPEVTMDCSVFVFNGNRLFESVLFLCSQRR